MQWTKITFLSSIVIYLEMNLLKQSHFAWWKNSTISFVSSSQSEGGESTVDWNGLSGDVVASFGCQVDNSSYHIIGNGVASNEGALGKSLGTLGVGKDRGCELRLDVSGRNVVDGDVLESVVGSKILGHGTGHSKVSGLCGSVRNGVREGQVGLRARNGHDAAVFLLLHGVRHGSRQKERSSHHQIQTDLPVIRSKVLCLLADVDSCVVEKDGGWGSSAGDGLSLSDEVRVLVVLEDIGWKRKGALFSANLVDVRGTFDEAISTASDQDNLGTSLGHTLGQTGSNSGASSGDNGDSSGQIKKLSSDGAWSDRHDGSISCCII